MSEDKRIPFYLALNALSSIGIVLVNKVVFGAMAFPYGTLLTVIHFVATFLGLCICLAMGAFQFKRIPIVKILPLCGSFCGFVALTNLSLLHNTVGFYQLMKVLTTPLLVIIQTMFYEKSFSTPIKLSLMVTCIGVAIATVTDSEANFLGTMIASSALLITCMYQIWVGTKQKELECNSYQLLFYQAPISAAMLMPIAYFADDLHHTFVWPCPSTIWVVLLSAALAFLVNLSIFLVIGKTSPVTYNVLGHFKLCTILCLGFAFFGNPIDFRNVTGILVTLAGVFSYTHIKMEEEKRAKMREEANAAEKVELKVVSADTEEDA